MRAYKRDVMLGRVGGLHLAAEDRGPYRLRTASNAPSLGVYGYSRPETVLDKLAAAVAAVLRVAVSAAILAAWMAAIYLYRDTPADLFGGGWMTVSHLLVPLGFFAVAMTNRRYGPAYALAQVVTTFAAVAGLLLFANPALDRFVPLDTVPSMREVLTFAGGFFVAGFVSIVAFDGARGPHWWTAPLIGFLAAAVVFAAVFYAGLYAAVPSGWLNQGLIYMGVLAGEGLLLLLPFWAMRTLMPPMSGFGGY